MPFVSSTKSKGTLNEWMKLIGMNIVIELNLITLFQNHIIENTNDIVFCESGDDKLKLYAIK